MDKTSKVHKKLNKTTKVQFRARAGIYEDAKDLKINISAVARTAVEMVIETAKQTKGVTDGRTTSTGADEFETEIE